MKLLLSIFLTFLFASNSFGQQADFDFDKISFNGLSFSLAKEDVIKAYGQAKVNYPEYDCGFYSNEQPGGPFYQLVYADFTYIGSDVEKFLLEHLDFDATGKTYLKYVDKTLNGLTTKAEFAEIFGASVKEHFEKDSNADSILLFTQGRDDGAVFIFKNGKLVRFEYWSPC